MLALVMLHLSYVDDTAAVILDEVNYWIARAVATGHPRALEFEAAVFEFKESESLKLPAKK